MNIISLFPTAVAKFSFGRNITAEEMAFFNWQEVYQNFGNTTSLNRYILKNDVMFSINEFIETSVNEYLKTICAPKNEVKLKITQSWVNYTKEGQHHHLHSHANSFLSGVFYIKADREKDKIYFQKSLYNCIVLPSENFNTFNSTTWWIEVGTGDLLIFPSDLGHMVKEVKGEDRISLSFNTFPVGYIGQEETLTALHLNDVA